MSDGCVYLLRELASVRCAADASVESTIYKLYQKHAMALADLGFVDHFKHSASMKEQLFKSLTAIASTEGLGKKKFRGFVELYLDPAFRNTKNNNQNCAVAAQDFLASLSKVFGENITRAIVENHDSSYVAEYDGIKQNAAGFGGQDFVYPGGERPNSQVMPPHHFTAFPQGPSPERFPPGWKPPSFQSAAAASAPPK